MHQFASRLITAAVFSSILFGLASCSGSKGTLPNLPSSAGVVHKSDTTGVTVSPSSLNFTATGPANSQKFVASTPFDGTIGAVSSDVTVATVDPASAETPKNQGDYRKSVIFTVTPVGQGTCTITVTDTKGNQASVSVSVAIGKPLFVANETSNKVTEYASPYTGAPIATISNSVNHPQGLAFDASGDLFVANYTKANVTEYAPPYTGAPTATISNSVSFPQGLAFDASGDLFVANAVGQGPNGYVTEYAPPYTGAPIATITNSVGVDVVGLAFDASGDLFVANSNNNNVTEYAPP